MTQPADDATAVLAMLRLLHDVGDATQDQDAADVIWALRASGVTAFTDTQVSTLLMAGTVLRLLLRHAETDPAVMFDLTATDLDALGTDISRARFKEIVERYDE